MVRLYDAVENPMTRRLPLLPLLALLAAAAPADPMAMIKVRHDGMKQIGAAFKEVGKQAKSGMPDAKLVAANAAALRRLSLAQLTWFPRGSGPDSGQKTHAKAEAWSDPMAFRAAQQRFVVEAAKLNGIATKGDMAALPAQFQATGATCRGCHDKFREKDED